MAILRRANFLSEQRVDVSHLRGIEAGVAADFDLLAGEMIAGSEPLIIKGFEVLNFVKNQSAELVQIACGDSSLINVNSHASGSIFKTESQPPEFLNSIANENVVGAFVEKSNNYIGLLIERKEDSRTADLVKFRNILGESEVSRIVPLAETLFYKIIISQIPFSATPNIIPVAIIRTENGNLIGNGDFDVIDARKLAFRLQKTEENPESIYSYGWPENREESNKIALTPTPIFNGGDKAIKSLKQWQDAIMSRVWEVGGGKNWYSNASDKNVKLVWNPASVFASTGTPFEFVSGNLHWENLKIAYENSSGSFSNLVAAQFVDVPGLTDLTPGQCLFVDLDRTQTAPLQMKKTQLSSLGSGSRPGSRWVIAWCLDAGVVFTRENVFPVNTTIKPATTLAIGGLRINKPATVPGLPTTLTLEPDKNLIMTPAEITGGGLASGQALISLDNSDDQGSVDAFTLKSIGTSIFGLNANTEPAVIVDNDGVGAVPKVGTSGPIVDFKGGYLRLKGDDSIGTSTPEALVCGMAPNKEGRSTVIVNGGPIYLDDAWTSFPLVAKIGQRLDNFIGPRNICKAKASIITNISNPIQNIIGGYNILSIVDVVPAFPGSSFLITFAMATPGKIYNITSKLAGILAPPRISGYLEISQTQVQISFFDIAGAPAAPSGFTILVF